MNFSHLVTKKEKRGGGGGGGAFVGFFGIKMKKVPHF